MTARQGPATGVLLFGRAERSQIRGPGIDTVLGKVPFHDQHLAAAAQGPATANRIHVNAERARGLEQGSADREAASLA